MSGTGGVDSAHDLIYTIVSASFDWLLFIPRKEAMDLARTWDALGTAQTWQEFRDKISAGEYEDYMVRSFDDTGKRRPKDDAPFKATDEGWEDGEWPTNPIYWMDSYVPASVMELGTPIVNVFGGSWIYADREAEALNILREEGYRVERDDELAKAACGEFLGS
jgi:hypothetical protein